MPSKVLVIGGNGFIGYNLIEALVWSGYEVTISSRRKGSLSQKLGIELYLDLESMDQIQLVSLLQVFDKIIYCGGADDRTVIKGDAKQFFRKENVELTNHLINACLRSGIQDVLILGSYFTYLDRHNPSWNLPERHPYILSRKEQTYKSTSMSNERTRVSIIEIPYVFGSSPGQKSLWSPLIKYISSSPIVLYTPGGTNCISVKTLSKAICNRLTSEANRKTWCISGRNISWKELIYQISEALGKKRRILTIPKFVLIPIAYLLKLYFKMTGRQMGLDPYHYMPIQCHHTYIDSEKDEVIDTGNDPKLESAIRESVLSFDL